MAPAMPTPALFFTVPLIVTLCALHKDAANTPAHSDVVMFMNTLGW
jgi:hypothetical protein